MNRSLRRTSRRAAKRAMKVPKTPALPATSQNTRTAGGNVDEGRIAYVEDKSRSDEPRTSEVRAHPDPRSDRDVDGSLGSTLATDWEPVGGGFSIRWTFNVTGATATWKPRLPLGPQEFDLRLYRESRDRFIARLIRPDDVHGLVVLLEV